MILTCGLNQVEDIICLGFRICLGFKLGQICFRFHPKCVYLVMGTKPYKLNLILVSLAMLDMIMIVQHSKLECWIPNSSLVMLDVTMIIKLSKLECYGCLLFVCVSVSEWVRERDKRDVQSCQRLQAWIFWWNSRPFKAIIAHVPVNQILVKRMQMDFSRNRIHLSKLHE